MWVGDPTAQYKKTKQKTGNETAKMYILTFLSRKYWKMVTWCFVIPGNLPHVFAVAGGASLLTFTMLFPFPSSNIFSSTLAKNRKKPLFVFNVRVCVRDRERSRDHLVFLLLCSPLLTDHYGSLWINWSLEALARDVGWQLRKILPVRAGHESRASLTYGLFIPPPDINEQNKETWTLWNDRGLRNKVCHEEKPTQFFF